MKTILFNADSKVYETPVVSEIKVNVERGFAESDITEDPEFGGDME